MVVTLAKYFAPNCSKTTIYHLFSTPKGRKWMHNIRLSGISKGMTTMDSDSESQDSDDGRRFRFEATRKDSSQVVRSRDLPHSSRSEHQSERNRKDNEKFLNRIQDSHFRHDSRHTSRDRDSKDRRDRHLQKYLKDSKDAHDSKHLKLRDDRESRSSPSQRERDDRETRDSKDFKDLKDRRESKSSRSYEKEPNSLRESRSSKERSRKRSRDSSRSDRSSSDKHKLKCHEKQKSHSKDNYGKLKEDRVLEKVEKLAKVPLEVKQAENNISKKDVDSLQDGCQEFNMSDFEIVSDLEEFSSDSSSCSHGYRSKMKVHHLKHKSSHLSDKHCERKKPRTEDLQKVNPMNGNHLTSSNSSIDSILPSTSISKQFKEDEKAATKVKLKADILHDSSLNESTNKSNQGEKSCTYGPLLSTKLIMSSSLSVTDNIEEANKEIAENYTLNEVSTNKKDGREKNLIGPLPPSSSLKYTNVNEDDLSSTVVEANLRQRNCDINNEEESKSLSEKLKNEESKESSQARIIGPSLPSHLVSQEIESDEDVYGPILPPHLKKEDNISKSKIYGPTLPTNLISDDIRSSGSDDDDEIIGPLPFDHPANKTSIVQQSLEFRARRIQNELMTEPVDKNKREAWMTELPAVQRVALGLGPRKFKVRDGPDLSDRSSWTDTPDDKARKRQAKAEERLAAIVNDKETIKELSFAKEDSSEKIKKREKSMLEIHQKKLKKKKKKEEKEAREKGKSTRRPFDRDVDLQANRFDEAQKKHIFMKAQLLDDRFTRGKM